MKINVRNLSSDELSQLAVESDTKTLNEISKALISEGTQEQKEIFAQDAYLDLFFTMAYDYYCGKLPDPTLSIFLEPIEKAEAILNKKLWHHRAMAHSYMMEEEIKNKNETEFLNYGNSAIDFFHKSIEESDSDIKENENHIALTYEQFAFYGKKNKIQNWISALVFTKRSVVLNPQVANWRTYIKLIYFPYDESEEFKQLQAKELLLFKDLIASQMPNDLIYVIPFAFNRYKEFLVYTGTHQKKFPEQDYLFYLEKSLATKPAQLNYATAILIGGFYNNEGLRLQRVDLLEAALPFFSKTIGSQQDHFYGVRRCAEIYKNIAEVYALKNKWREANESLKSASDLYSQHIQEIKTDYSPALDYAEFLEFCYLQTWNSNKPPLEEVKKFADLAARLGAGYNDSACFLQIRLLLLEKNEEEALFILTKEFLIHENLLSRSLKKLGEMRSFQKFSQCISDHNQFFRELENVYYYDPKYTWDQVEKMTREEVFKAWEERKVELKTRPALLF